MILQNWCIIQLIEGEIKRRLSPEMSSKVWRDATLRLARMHEEHLRRYTCANADICDYRIVGDESEEVKSHPRKTNEKGYWYNHGGFQSFCSPIPKQNLPRFIPERFIWRRRRVSKSHQNLYLFPIIIWLFSLIFQ